MGQAGLDHLTISDLQQLEQLAVKASQEGQEGEEGEKQLTNMLRRSLSLGPLMSLDERQRDVLHLLKRARNLTKHDETCAQTP